MSNHFKRITPQLYFSLVLTLFAAYTIYVGSLILNNSTTRKPINDLPTKNTLSLTLIIASAVEIVISLFGIMAYIVKGQSFLILLIISLGILAVFYTVSSCFLFVATIKFDHLDMLSNDALISIEYEVCYFA